VSYLLPTLKEDKKEMSGGIDLEEDKDKIKEKVTEYLGLVDSFLEENMGKTQVSIGEIIAASKRIEKDAN